MKSFFLTLLFLGGAFAAYDYFFAPPGQKIIFKQLNPPPKPKTVVEAAPEPEKPAEAPVPAPAPEAAKPVAPAKVVETMPAPVAPAAPKAGSIEALTNNWSTIPPTAFPREVTLLKDAEFKMPVGASKVTSGRKVQAIAFRDGQLALLSAPGSSAKAIVSIDDTDLKKILTDIYEKWKVARAEYLKKNAAQKQQMASTLKAENATANSNRAEVDETGKPLRGDDRGYPLLLSSIRRGQVTDIKADKIISWGEPNPTKVQGKDGWAIKVEYQAETIFGLQPVEAQALVVNGRVQGWFYTGSGEEVP
ncbi:MAG: hypothetical protein RIS79_795 [Verrucomicrobiota bacterium]|jgi:hypothetical protein